MRINYRTPVRPRSAREVALPYASNLSSATMVVRIALDARARERELIASELEYDAPRLTDRTARRTTMEAAHAIRTRTTMRPSAGQRAWTLLRPPARGESISATPDEERSPMQRRKPDRKAWR